MDFITDLPPTVRKDSAYDAILVWVGSPSTVDIFRHGIASPDETFGTETRGFRSIEECVDAVSVAAETSSLKSIKDTMVIGSEKRAS